MLSAEHSVCASGTDMTPDAFCNRLSRIATKRSLTASDLAIWFARPRQTVRTWLDNARDQANAHRPTTGPVFRECVRRLYLLERSSYFPVPYEVLKHARKSYITKAFLDANDAGVPRGRATRRGTLLPSRTRPGA